VTAARTARVLGSLALVAALTIGLFGLILSPPDRVMGDLQRIMYVHVPSVIAAYAAALTLFGASIWYLLRRDPRADMLALSAGELTVLMLGLTLVTGSIWGRPTWGVYWTWDARLTITLMQWFVYVGYLVLRQATDDPEVRARRSAVLGVVAVVGIPLIHASVYIWRSLHQPPTILRPELITAPERLPISGLMLSTLFIAMAGFIVISLYLLARRYELARRQNQLVAPGPVTAGAGEMA
jgi:heme exporter protein C